MYILLNDSVVTFDINLRMMIFIQYVPQWDHLQFGLKYNIPLVIWGESVAETSGRAVA